jgi:MtN3 and saliva related transmembrane protein
MSELAINIIGWIAASLTTISTIPQAIEVVRSKKTEGISLIMYILFVTGILCWIMYGFMDNQPQLYVANIITFVFASITLGFKIYNVAKGNEPFINSSKKEEKK